MKQLFLIFISLTYVINAWADNVLSLSTTNGNNGDEITVSAALSLTSDISAAEFSVNLGPQLKYVDGSCTFNSDRLDNHTTSVNVDGETLKVYIYSLSLSSIKIGDGELFSFKLKCGNEPGQYSLSPKMILSDSSGKEVSSSALSTSMMLYAGKVSVPNKLDFPKAFVGMDNVANLTVTNSGNKKVSISNIIPSCDWIKVSQTQFIIEAGASSNITITVNPLLKGTMQESLKIVSDAGNSEVIIPISINAVKQNQIVVPVLVTSKGGQPVSIDVSLDNQDEVTAVEFTIDMPQGIEVVPNSCITAARTEGFNAYVSQKGNKCTVYLLSLSNKVIEGSSGKVLSFDLKPNTWTGTYNLQINNVKILNKGSVNVASETNSEMQINVESPQLAMWSWQDFRSDYVPVGEEQDDMLQIHNSGNSLLIISAIQSDDKCCYVKDEFPIYISPGEEYKFRVMVKCDKVGDFITSLTVLSNDPAQPEYKTVVSTKIIDVNALALSGELQNEDKTFNMNVGMNNSEDISAVQMDIHCPEFATTDATKLQLSDRLSQTHQFSIAQLKSGVYRVIIYSTNNAVITGKIGSLFTLSFDNSTSNALNYRNFSVDNVVLGNKKGQNVCSIDHYGFYDVVYYTYRDPFGSGFEQTESKVVGTGTTIEYHEQWVGEPLVMGVNDISVLRWTNSFDNIMYHVTFYDEDNTTILTRKNVPSNYSMKAPTPPTKNGRVFYGWAADGIIVSNSADYTFSVQNDIQLSAVYTDKIRISETNISLVKGMPYFLKVLCGDDNIEVNNVQWTSSNQDVIAVSWNGAVTGEELGSAIIRAEIPGTGLSFTCNVTVIPNIYKLTYIVDGVVYSQVDVQFGTYITPQSDPSKEGYTFSGWSDIPTTMPANDVTITGSFTVNKYKLIYKVDGVKYNESEVEFGASITPIEAPTKEGKTFSGWSNIPPTMPSHDVTVTGTFQSDSYLLTYNVDGKVYSQEYVVFGSTIIPQTVPTKEGYTFSGWSEIPTTMPANDVTITGSFTVNKYKLIYMVDGVKYNESEVEFGASITPIEAPTKEGKTFSGWSNIPPTMPSHDVTVTGHFTSNGQVVDPGTPDSNPWFNYNVTSSITVTIVSIDVSRGNISSYQELVVPNTVIYDGKQYFVTGLGPDCFNNARFQSLSIPASVTDIPHVYGSMSSHLGDMYQCKEYIVDEANTAFCSKDGVLFTKDMKELVKYPAAKNQTDYVVPTSVEYICNQAFRSVKSLTNLQLSANTKAIGTYAFDATYSLKSVKLPTSVVPENAGVSYFVGTGDMVLYVRNTILNEYKNKTPWTSFKEIQGYDVDAIPVITPQLADNSELAEQNVQQITEFKLNLNNVETVVVNESANAELYVGGVLKGTAGASDISVNLGVVTIKFNTTLYAASRSMVREFIEAIVTSSANVIPVEVKIAANSFKIDGKNIADNISYNYSINETVAEKIDQVLSIEEIHVDSRNLPVYNINGTVVSGDIRSGIFIRDGKIILIK